MTVMPISGVIGKAVVQIASFIFSCFFIFFFFFFRVTEIVDQDVKPQIKITQVCVVTGFVSQASL